MKFFRVRGWFKQGFGRQRFTRELVTLSREQALERVYSEVGSRHRVRRNLIHIEEAVEIKREEVKDRRLISMLEGS
jgi:large subunit ribosomal protein LX